MANQLTEISPEIGTFIENQKIFFVGTAATTGSVNVSPKGMDSFRVINPKQVIWLNLTGSGNETAAHLLDNNRMTIMFCAFEGKPLILRLYGKAKTYHPTDNEWADLFAHFPTIAGARQIYELDIDLVQTSCGFAVPLMEYQADRSILKDWAEKQGEEGVRAYWAKKNTQSIDGFPTGIVL